jgi:hypothetical protein
MLIVLTGIKTFGGNFELFKFLTALWIRIRRVDYWASRIPIR